MHAILNQKMRSHVGIVYKFLMSVFIVAALLSLSGCRKGDCTEKRRYTIYNPIFASAAEVRASFKAMLPQPIEESGKIYLYGNYIFLNEVNKGIHVIDNSNPEAPVNIAFVNIPGNVDLAVKGNVLYADSYIDLLALDISDPHNVKELKRLENIFPYRRYDYYIATSDSIVVGYTTRDTVVEEPCRRPNDGFLLYDAAPGSFASLNSSGSGGKSSTSAALGKGGSMAKFALSGNFLYTVDYSSLNVFGLQDPKSPTRGEKIYAPGTVETIFPYKGNLFIGSQNGMFIYGLNNPSHPTQKGVFGHVRSCDPVVVNDTVAYVTLRGGNACGGYTNQLDVLDITDLTSPTLIRSYPMVSPYGLGIDGESLFVCEGKNGLRFLNAALANNIQQITRLPLEAYDVIPHNNILLVTAKDGLYQYDYSTPATPRLLSKLPITPEQE